MAEFEDYEAELKKTIRLRLGSKHRVATRLIVKRCNSGREFHSSFFSVTKTPGGEVGRAWPRAVLWGRG